MNTALRRPKKVRTLRQQNERMGYLMVSPIVVGILCFSIMPVFFSMFISFTSWNMMTPFEWIGLQNYVTVFTGKMLGTVWGNTLKYIAGIIK